MYFTLAISAASRQRCAALVSAARDTDPRVMPVPGPVRVGWQAPDECTAILHWGAPDSSGASHAGTIWISVPPGVLRARTGLARIDPVYLAESPDAVVVGDRASWVATVTGHLDDHDPVMVGAFLSVGYPIGAATPFRGVRALDGGQTLRVSGGRMVLAPPDDHADTQAVGAFAMGGPPGVHPVGGALAGVALVEAVSPLGDAGDGSVPVELSLTGGKDSRLIAAALAAAGVPFRARTHGFASHPDVIIAGMIAERLGVEHTVTEPRPATQAPDQAELLSRLRGAVLVADGMLSAFENVGSWVRDPPDTGTAEVREAGSEPVQAGGHGGELLRGGYAQAAWMPAPGWKSTRAWSDAAGVELFRRLTTRRLRLLRPGAAAAYLASLGPAAAALPGGPLRALDDFYLANRAGRWSAAARQAYLIRAPLAQPFFSDSVIRAARAVPLPQRMNDQLHREVLASLCPELLDIPLAGKPWHGEPQTPETVLTTGPGSATAPDWRRERGGPTARFLREYVLDLGDAGPMFGMVRRRAVERLLQPPQADLHAAWALATLAALLSSDWLNARGPVSPPSGLSAQQAPR